MSRCQCTVIQDSGRRTRCSQDSTKDKDYCYYHDKVMDGLCETDPAYIRRYWDNSSGARFQSRKPDFIVAFEGVDGKRVDIKD